MGAVRKCAAKHFQDVSSRVNCKQECGTRGRGRGQGSGGRDEMAGMRKCLVVFPL